MSEETRVQKYLLEFLVERFVLDELKELAWLLGVEPENLRHSTKPEFSRELISFCRKLNMIKCLVEEVLQQRPDTTLKRLAQQLPVCSPRKKIELNLYGNGLNKVQLINTIASWTSATGKIVVLAGTVEGLHWLISLPESAANHLQNINPSQLIVNSSCQVGGVQDFTTLPVTVQKMWFSTYQSRITNLATLAETGASTVTAPVVPAIPIGVVGVVTAVVIAAVLIINASNTSTPTLPIAIVQSVIPIATRPPININSTPSFTLPTVITQSAPITPILPTAASILASPEPHGTTGGASTGGLSLTGDNLSGYLPKQTTVVTIQENGTPYWRGELTAIPGYSIGNGKLTIEWFSGSSAGELVVKELSRPSNCQSPPKSIGGCNEWSYPEQHVSQVKVTFDKGGTVTASNFSESDAVLTIPDGATKLMQVEMTFADGDLNWTYRPDGSIDQKIRVPRTITWGPDLLIAPQK